MFKNNVSRGDKVTFERDGFTVSARIESDDDADTSFIGEFSDEPKEGAIDHHEQGRWLDRGYQGPRYFNPASYPLDYWTQQPGVTPERAKAESDRQAMSDYERLVDYHHGYWSMVGVVLTISLEGVVLADASLWGIESDSDGYFNEVVDDLFHESSIEARKKIKALAKAAKKIKKVA